MDTIPRPSLGDVYSICFQRDTSMQVIPHETCCHIWNSMEVYDRACMIKDEISHK